jgi:uncharacterized membrane protein YfcA
MLTQLIPIIIGIILGLLGGGGAILCVPAFIYVYHFDVKVAIAMSLFVVGISSLFGTVIKLRNNQVQIKESLAFGLFSMTGSFFVAKYFASMVSSDLQLLLFVILMLIIAFSMLRKKTIAQENQVQKKINFITLLFVSLLTGAVTGLLGIGGGFLIVPVFVTFMGMQMQAAIASSLFVITLQAMTGFWGYLGQYQYDWSFLFSFTAFMILGVFVGIYSSRFFSENILKRIFASLLIVISLIMLLKGEV